MEGVIVTISFFAAVFGIMYMFYTTRNKERMALIDKGADASLFNTGKTGGFSWSKFTLKIGMFLVGISLGIVAGSLLADSGALYDGVSYPSMIFFFGGLSLIVYYIIFDRKSK
ncbi:MAG: DUF6249 domain-containing protein [Bacteroidales bacterium]